MGLQVGSIRTFAQTAAAATTLGLVLLVVACASRPPDCGQLEDLREEGNAGCLVVNDGRLLMVKQRLTGHWALPGGTAETDERSVCTASRETKEETGYTVRVIRQIHQFYNGFRLYECEADFSELPHANDQLEISDVAWLDLEQRNQVPWRFEKQREIIQQLVEKVGGGN